MAASERLARINESAAGGEAPGQPRWCDQIPTPAENQLYPYSEHSYAHRHSHDFGKLFGDEGVKPKTRSCCEYHSAGISKTVRTAVGRSIFPADGISRTSKPAAEEGEPADCRAYQEQKKTRVEAAGLRSSPAV
jgi:hypothetical protein